MAYPQFGSSVPTKLSFAKIAAMPAPSIAPALPHLPREIKNKPSINAANLPVVTRPQHGLILPTVDGEEHKSSRVSSDENVEQVRSAIEGLGLVRARSGTVQNVSSSGTGDSLQDDQSQLSGSSLKQQSFETKSMTSVTTFAMDEKESIRPDDSASVRAVDDDESHFGMSSSTSFQQEVEAQPHVHRTAMRVVAPGVTIAARRYPGLTLINPPRFGDLPIGPVDEVVHDEPSLQKIPIETPDLNSVHSPVLIATPDEKLLEALGSLKDRLPLLQLEEKLMSFISQSRDDVLELPPQNSFNRLLTHKLADYYNLAHQVSEDNTSVRIFRASCPTFPPSLAEIARAISIGPPQASNAAHVKIMQRARLGRGFSAGTSTAASSSVASKATSENGGETNSEEGLQSPLDGTPNRDKSKPTREEREAQYKAARERIFGDFQESVTSESGSTGETSASMSRSSSSSGKKKQRKHKTPKDDSFEARSAFVASYTPMHMQTAYQQPYSEMQFPGAYSTPTSNYPPNVYAPSQTQTYPGYDPNLTYGGPISPDGGMGQAYASNEGWQGIQQTQSYNFPQLPYQQQSQLPHINSQFQQAPPQTIPGSWMPTQPQQPYTHPQTISNSTQWPQYGQQTNMQNIMPYQYGQLPPQGYNAAAIPSSQHPIPGSYTSARSLFNPQTRSFVPNSNPGRPNGRVNRKKGMQAPNTTRSSNSSGSGSPALHSVNGALSPKPKEDSLQQKYGTPANLPKKPPPSQNPSHFTSEPNQASSSTATAAKVVANGDSN